MNFKDYVTTVPNFPKDGIMFRDITPLIRDGKAFNACIDEIAEYGKRINANVVIGPELPREVIKEEYSLEYGSNTLCLLADAVKNGDRVLIVDDLLATGGTVKASIELVERLGGKVVGIACPIELPALKGRDLLKGYDVFTLMSYDGD